MTCGRLDAVFLFLTVSVWKMLSLRMASTSVGIPAFGTSNTWFMRTIGRRRRDGGVANGQHALHIAAVSKARRERARPATTRGRSTTRNILGLELGLKLAVYPRTVTSSCCTQPPWLNESSTKIKYISFHGSDIILVAKFYVCKSSGRMRARDVQPNLQYIATKSVQHRAERAARSTTFRHLPC